MRLIDADALEEILKNAITIQEGMAVALGIEKDEGVQMELKAYRDILNGIQEQPTIGEENSHPTCMNCRKEIDAVEVLLFDHEGSDHWVMSPIFYDEPTGGVSIKTTRNWTSYDDQESYKETIKCPFCHEHPFDKEAGCEVHEPIEIVMWTKGRRSEQ